MNYPKKVLAQSGIHECWLGCDFWVRFLNIFHTYIHNINTIEYDYCNLFFWHDEYNTGKFESLKFIWCIVVINLGTSLLKRDCGRRLFAAYGPIGTIIYNRTAYVLVGIAFFRFPNRKTRISPTIHTNTNERFVYYYIVGAQKNYYATCVEFALSAIQRDYIQL